MAKNDPKEILLVAGREVTITNPQKVYFPAIGATKLDLVRYYLAVAEGALVGVRGRPMALKRYVEGIDKPFFFQKRAPATRPEWVETAVLRFPSGRTAEEIVVSDAAQLAWIINLGCIDLNPHPVRADDLEHPDELRVDLDPTPGVTWAQIRDVAALTREVLAEHGLVGWPKTSGSRGIHINVRIERRHGFTDVRRAALALARDVEARAPGLATAEWWKENRQGVFIDYNQNAKDRTVASAYSVRPTPDARVSMPLSWEELRSCEPEMFTMGTVPDRLRAEGDRGVGIDEAVGSLDSLLERAARYDADGVPDAPWPPHYAKQSGELPRVAPSRARKNRPAPRRSALITVAQSKDKDGALAGLERWKARHPAAAAHLRPNDVLVDAMRGRYTTWTRVRINLDSVPESERPAPEPPDPDYDPWAGSKFDRRGAPTDE